MTVQNPPLYLQAGTHPAEDFRHLISQAFGSREGVIGSGLAVTEKSGTPDMSVDVAEGSCLVAGTEGTYQGLYLCHNRGNTNLAISAADGTNSRYDLVVAQVEDSDYSGATDAWKLAIVTGTPAATPLFPTVPDNALVIATVLVGNGVSSIVDADITDIRSASDSDGTTTLVNYGRAASLGGVVSCTSTTRPQSPSAGDTIWETDTTRKMVYNGTAWMIEYSEWEDYTPVMFGGLTSIGNGSLYGRYHRIGNTISFSIFLSVGSTTTFDGTDFSFTLPEDVADGNTRFSASGYARDGTFRYASVGVLIENTSYVQAIGAGGGAFDSTTPFTWASTDYLVISGTYETDAAV